MTSDELSKLQIYLEQYLKEMIDDPMTDYKRAKSILDHIKTIDTQRRETWHSEKFGASEEIADNALSRNFTADDIPF